MHLEPKMVDRAAGVLLGAAAGDALGVHYETGIPVGPDGPQMNTVPTVGRPS
jgi:hypothetical protein